jgi:hypothetical protein
MSSTHWVPTLTLLTAALGYFVYGGINGALAIFVLDILSGLAVLLGFIPVVGVLLTYMINDLFVFPFVFNLTGITATWLTNFIFWANIVISAICSLCAIVWIYCCG